MAWFSSDEDPSWKTTGILLLIGAIYWILVFVVPALLFVFLHLCRHRKAWERSLSRSAFRNTSFLWGKVRSRTYAFVHYYVGKWMDNVRVAFILAIIIANIATSVQQRIDTGWGITMLVSGIYLTLDFFFRTTLLPLERSTWWWLVSYHTGCTAFSLSSAIAAGLGYESWLNLNFLVVIPFYFAVVKVIYGSLAKDPRFMDVAYADSGSVNQYVVAWTWYLFFLCVSFAGMFLTLEVLGNPDGFAEWSVTINGWNFLTGTVFSMVTITTVGYGNLTPDSYPGIIFMSMVIVYGIFYIAQRLSILFTQLSKFRQGGGSYRRNFLTSPQHVVVAGDFRPGDLLAFTTAFYTRRWNMSTNIVLLSWSTQLSGRERNLLARSEIGNKVSFIRGEAMDRNDRERAAVAMAEACAVLSPIEAENLEEADKINAMRVLGIRSNAPKVPIFSVHRLTSSNRLFENACYTFVDKEARAYHNGESLGFDRIISLLVVLNLRCPGFSTFFTNLVMLWRFKPSIDDPPGRLEYKADYGMVLMCVVSSNLERTVMVNELEADYILPNECNISVLGAEEQVDQFLEDSDEFEAHESIHRLRMERNLPREPGTLPQTGVAGSEPTDAEVDDDMAGASAHLRVLHSATLSVVGHTVIAAFSKNSLSLVFNILERQQAHLERKVVLLMPDLNESEVEQLQARNVSVVVTDPSRAKALRRVNLHKASAVIILMEETVGSDQGSVLNDSKPSYCLLLVQSIVKNLHEDQKPIIQILSRGLHLESSLEHDFFLKLDQVAQSTVRDIGLELLEEEEEAEEGYSKESLESLPDHYDSLSTMSRGDPLPDVHDRGSTGRRRRRKFLEQAGTNVIEDLENIEIFSTSTYMSGSLVMTAILPGMIASEICAPGSFGLFRNLLSAENDVSRVHALRVPGIWSGRTWIEFFIAVNRRNGIALGLFRHPTAQVCTHHVMNLPTRSSACDGDGTQASLGDRWMYTNPAHCTVLSSEDLAYVYVSDVRRLNRQLSSSRAFSRPSMAAFSRESLRSSRQSEVPPVPNGDERPSC
ncbi:hypothetical protein NDN08_007336 [Rhodosorus marinus]|uniref:Uncharacterized protein n=1 Tax=Rhodosorus marinus TaxID=101924 RepID=A0AAV8UG89_9RHOD|nr:hypothetical protein NDN08_007336 [Rhodosorus marinus]